MAKEKKDNSIKPITVRGPRELWDQLDQHIRKYAGFQRPNRNAWILNAVVEQMTREDKEKSKE